MKNLLKRHLHKGGIKQVKVLNLAHEVAPFLKRDILENKGEGDSIHLPPQDYGLILEYIDKMEDMLAAKCSSKGDQNPKRQASSPQGQLPGQAALKLAKPRI